MAMYGLSYFYMVKMIGMKVRRWIDMVGGAHKVFSFLRGDHSMHDLD